jgi:hypothetical protein
VRDQHAFLAGGGDAAQGKQNFLGAIATPKEKKVYAYNKVF